MGLLSRHRVHLLLAPSRLQTGGSVVHARRRTARRSVVAQNIRRRDADARRRSSVLQRDVGTDRSERKRVAAKHGAASARATRRARPDRCSAARVGSVQREIGATGAVVGTACGRRRSCTEFPSIRLGTPYMLDAATGDVGLGAGRSSPRCRPSLPPRQS